MFADVTNNNGNPSEDHHVPLEDAGNFVAQRDDYAYDSLNRLSVHRTAYGQGRSGDAIYGSSQAFSYDRWGNRKIDHRHDGRGEQLLYG